MEFNLPQFINQTFSIILGVLKKISEEKLESSIKLTLYSLSITMTLIFSNEISSYLEPILKTKIEIKTVITVASVAILILAICLKINEKIKISKAKNLKRYLSEVEEIILVTLAEISAKASAQTPIALSPEHLLLEYQAMKGGNLEKNKLIVSIENMQAKNLIFRTPGSHTFFLSPKGRKYIDENELGEEYNVSI